MLVLETPVMAPLVPNTKVPTVEVEVPMTETQGMLIATAGLVAQKP